MTRRITPALALKLQRKTEYDFVIGIDCGTQTGFAAYDRSAKRLTHVQCLKIHQALELTKAWIMDRRRTLVRVEDARMAVYGRKNDYYKAQGAGSVKRDCSIWEDFLKEYKFDYEMVRPNAALTKLDAEKFRQITGWTEKTNNHGRDAGMICFSY